MDDAAIHEAAHCIMGLTFGWNLEDVKVDGNKNGVTRWSNNEIDEQRWAVGVAHARRALCVVVAGNVAEGSPISVLFKARPNIQQRLKPSFRDDYRAASQAFAICHGEARGQGLLGAILKLEIHEMNGGLQLSAEMLDEIEGAERRAEEILEGRQAELATLAAALRGMGALDGGQVCRILDRVATRG